MFKMVVLLQCSIGSYAHWEIRWPILVISVCIGAMGHHRHYALMTRRQLVVLRSIKISLIAMQKQRDAM